MFKKAGIAGSAVVIISPALAQEEDGLAEAKTELVGLLQAAGFKDANGGSMSGDEDRLEFQNVVGHRVVGGRADAFDVGLNGKAKAN
jgi:hypothetical protein